MTEDQQSRRRAVLADRIFDGRRWHARAALLCEGGRVGGLAAAGDVPDGCARERLPTGRCWSPGSSTCR